MKNKEKLEKLIKKYVPYYLFCDIIIRRLWSNTQVGEGASLLRK